MTARISNAEQQLSRQLPLTQVVHCTKEKLQLQSAVPAVGTTMVSTSEACNEAAVYQ